MSKAVDSLRDLFPSLSLSFHITSEEEEEELRRKNKGVWELHRLNYKHRPKYIKFKKRGRLPSTPKFIFGFLVLFCSSFPPASRWIKSEPIEIERGGRRRVGGGDMYIILER